MKTKESKTSKKRRVFDPEMAWQPAEKVYWCKVCQIMHPDYFKCKAEGK